MCSTVSTFLLPRAEREAWKERHPGHRVEGCMFHMCQVIHWSVPLYENMKQIFKFASELQLCYIYFYIPLYTLAFVLYYNMKIFCQYLSFLIDLNGAILLYHFI